FSKKVQQEKLAARQESKKQELDKLKLIRKKAKSRTNQDEGGAEDFNVQVDDSIPDDLSKKKEKGSRGPNPKRRAKDAKYGSGGKSRRDRSNTRASTDDFDFNPKKMKAGASGGRKGAKSFGGAGGKKGNPLKGKKGGGVVKKRLGKSKRQK
ncbi:rRNA-processing protein and EBNA1-binding protein ebp2, partial [Dinochytrium kinnereticum]